VGNYENGKLTQGRYGRVVGATLDDFGMPIPNVELSENGLVYKHDPSTWSRMR